MPPDDDERILRMIRLAIYSCRAFLGIPVFVSGSLHKNPGFIPLDRPSVYTAWRHPGNPGFIPLGGIPGTQVLSRLAASRNPRFYPAWRHPGNPGFIPLGGIPRTQVLSRLAASQEPRFYPAWWHPKNPGFIPLGGESAQDTFILPLAYAVSTTSADCRAKMPFVTTPGILLMISSSLNGSVISR